MDDIALRTLRQEMLDDARVAREAFQKAIIRFERGEEIAHEACAHQLCRVYNSFEQTCLRVAKVFENNIDDEQGWHSSLLNRMTIGIQGIRPAFIPQPLKLPLQDLKAFRHVFVHAYELELDPQKLELLLKYARAVTDRLPELVEEFIGRVATEQGIDM